MKNLKTKKKEAEKWESYRREWSHEPEPEFITWCLNYNGKDMSVKLPYKFSKELSEMDSNKRWDILIEEYYKQNDIQQWEILYKKPDVNYIINYNGKEMEITISHNLNEELKKITDTDEWFKIMIKEYNKKINFL